MDKPSLLLHTDRLILRSSVESDVPKLKAFDERNANRLSPWRSTEPGGELDYVSQVMKWKQELEDGSAIRFLLINGQWEDHILTSLTNHQWIPR